MKECKLITFNDKVETLWEGVIIDEDGYIFSTIINSHISLNNNKLIVNIENNETIYNLKELYSTDNTTWYDVSLTNEFNNDYTLVSTKELVEDIRYNNYKKMLSKKMH